MESWRRQTGDGGRHWARRMRSEIVAPKLYVALLGIVKKSTEDYLLGGCATRLNHDETNKATGKNQEPITGCFNPYPEVYEKQKPETA